MANLHPDEMFLCCFNRVRDGHMPDCVHALRAKRLAAAIKRAKGHCEMRFSLTHGTETRCMGVVAGPFYTSDGRVRMLCDECWEEQADYQQRIVAGRRLTP